MKSFIALAGLALAVSHVAAEPAFTAPVAGTTITAGKAFKATWQDDGNTPTSETFGEGTIFLGIGGTVTQIKLATLGTVDFATATSLSITIPANVGPSASGEYFLRAESTTTDPSSAYGDPYIVFSAKFDLTGATGTFNATESSIAGGGNAAVSTSASGSLSASAATTATPSSSSSSRSTITSTIPLPTTGFANGTQSAHGNSSAASTFLVGMESRPIVGALSTLAIIFGYFF